MANEIDLADKFDEQGELIIPPSVVAKNSEVVKQYYRVVRFRNRALLQVDEPYPHFEILHKEKFEQIAYPLLGGVTRSRMSDVLSFLANSAEDLTEFDHLIMFGVRLGDSEISADTNLEFIHKNKPVVWDMRDLSVDVGAMDADKTVWRSPYQKIADPDKKPVPFIMQLAGNDAGLYDDIMQSIAPLIMAKKPDGVIWWVGDGANGKSTLMDALYKIFPGQLSSINVKRLTDGRDTPSLNGTLGNIVKESSEGRIDDTEVYKSIGTHEDFRVHKFHSQDDVLIRGNLHHIFSANSIPAFNDKGFSARRRTFIVPFGQRFESDPTFEEKTFTQEMFGHLISEMMRYAVKIRDQGYRYNWSAATLAAKADYDTEANSAEEYAKSIIEEGVIGFDSFNPVRVDYENWCADNGYVPLGIGNLRRALNALGFDRVSYKNDHGAVSKRYKLPNYADAPVTAMGMGRPGLFVAQGWQPPEDDDEPDTEPTKPAAKQTTIGDKW